MAHEKVYGFCENKCKVEVPTKADYDANMGKLDKITIDASGNIVGNVKGNANGLLFVKGVIVEDSGDELFASPEAQSVSLNSGYSSSAPYEFEVKDYIYAKELPIRHTWGVYSRKEDLIGVDELKTSLKTVAVVVGNNYGSSVNVTLYYKSASSDTYLSSTQRIGDYRSSTYTLTLPPDTYHFYTGDNKKPIQSISVEAGTTSYYIKYDTP